MRHSFLGAVGIAILLVCGLGPAPPGKPASDFDPDVIAKGYLAAWHQVEQKALGMTPEHAREFRKISQAALLRKAERSYGYSESDLRTAVRGYQDRLAREAAAARAAAENAKLAGKVGYVGSLAEGRTIATSFQSIEEKWTLERAGDSLGLERLRKSKALLVVGAPTGVRVLEVLDFRRIDQGHYLRVRLTTGPAAGEDAYCYPSDVGPPQ